MRTASPLLSSTSLSLRYFPLYYYQMRANALRLHFQFMVKITPLSYACSQRLLQFVIVRYFIKKRTTRHYTGSQPIVQSVFVNARHCTTPVANLLNNPILLMRTNALRCSQPVVQSTSVNSRHCITPVANLLYNPLF